MIYLQNLKLFVLSTPVTYKRSCALDTSSFDAPAQSASFYAEKLGLAPKLQNLYRKSLASLTLCKKVPYIFLQWSIISHYLQL